MRIMLLNLVVFVRDTSNDKALKNRHKERNRINSKLNCHWLFDNEKMQHLRISALEHT